MSETRKPTWGDTVKVRESAPAVWRPGAFASVCAIALIENEHQSAHYRGPIGTTGYTIEFGDGSSVEVPEDVIDLVDEDS